MSVLGEVDWVQNVRWAERVRLSRRRRAEDFRATEISAEEAGPLLRAFVGAVPDYFVQPYFRVSEEDDAAAFVAEARYHPVFRLRASCP